MRYRNILIIGFPRTVTTLLYQALCVVVRKHGWKCLFEPLNLDIWKAVDSGLVNHDTVGFVINDNREFQELRKLAEYVRKSNFRLDAYRKAARYFAHWLAHQEKVICKDVILCLAIDELLDILPEDVLVFLTYRDSAELVESFVREWIGNTTCFTRRLSCALRGLTRRLVLKRRLSPLSLARAAAYLLRHVAMRDAKIVKKFGIVDLARAAETKPTIIHTYVRYLELVRKVSDKPNVVILDTSKYALPRSLALAVDLVKRHCLGVE